MWRIGHTLVQHRSPLIVALLYWVRHVVRVRAGEQSTYKGNRRHRLEDCSSCEGGESSVGCREGTRCGIGDGIESSQKSREGWEAHRSLYLGSGRVDSVDRVIDNRFVNVAISTHSKLAGATMG